MYWLSAKGHHALFFTKVHFSCYIAIYLPNMKVVLTSTLCVLVVHTVRKRPKTLDQYMI
jgi:hypothetical protein